MNKRMLKLSGLLVIAACVMVLTGLGATDAKAHGRSKDVKVMTMNMYLGADFGPVFASTTPQELLGAVAKIYSDVQLSNIPERAAAQAREISKARPDLVGLQEVSIWRTGPFGGPATTVQYDALQLLLDELDRLGLEYTPVAILTNFEAEAPSALGFNVGFTDRDVMLARTDHKRSRLKLSNIRAQHFTTLFSFTNPVLGSLTVPRGWISVDAKSDDDERFRFITAHLESFSLAIQEIQASEVVQGPGRTSRTNRQVILAGDFNSDAESNDPQLSASYRILIDAGFADAWTKENPRKPGFTWPLHGENPFIFLTPTQRIDLVLYRGTIRVLDAQRVGHRLSNLTPSGLRPSDHAAVVATLKLGRAHQESYH